MTTPGSNEGAAPAPFTKRDMENILAILDNQSTQNLKVAREVMGLQSRFTVFCTKYLLPAEKPTQKGGKDKGKPESEPNPAS